MHNQAQSGMEKPSLSTQHFVDIDLAEAQRVLNLEALALSQMANTLTVSFSGIVSLFANLKGRVIVTGMGKSGHVARKIAATLSSTGTPSFFVHPGEASHGDLGMISSQDAIFALSNSGETTELSDIIAFAHRHAIPLIGMTKNSDSSLAVNAQLALIIPNVEEACPLGLAPTTSTTSMMALGDAIATAVLKRREFTPADFRSLHPGGQLGQRLLKVEHLMHMAMALPLVDQSTLMKHALLVMTQKGFGCIGVIDDAGKLIGIITDGDIRRHLEDDLLNCAVDQIMTSDPMTVTASTLAAEALLRMNNHTITSLFVTKSVEDATPIGLIHIHDCLKAGLS